MNTPATSSTATTPSARRSLAEQARLDAALVELFEQRISFNQVLGLRLESVRHGDVKARLAMRPELVGHHAYGRLHGGVISATLDVMGGLALMVAIGERHAHESTPQVMHRFMKMATIDLRVDYLRPGLGASFTASGEVTRLGSRLGSTLMRMFSDSGELIATGAAAYVVA
jgi:uncharacterized protein (TIGR00369 family)